jgi:hypothetical protein
MGVGFTLSGDNEAQADGDHDETFVRNFGRPNCLCPFERWFNFQDLRANQGAICTFHRYDESKYLAANG